MSFDRVVLRKHNENDIEFMGKKVASSGNVTVYETPKGHWLCTAFDMYGNSLEHAVVENKNEQGLHKLLGNTDNSKKIYSQLGLNLNNQLDL